MALQKYIWCMNKLESESYALKDEDEDSCQGDSGGPLVIRNGNNHATGENDIQVGVVSWVSHYVSTEQIILTISYAVLNHRALAVHQSIFQVCRTILCACHYSLSNIFLLSFGYQVFMQGFQVSMTGSGKECASFHRTLRLILGV
jgi:hypothetical protein